MQRYGVSGNLSELWAEEHGAAASEYAISLAFIAVAVAAAASQFDLTAVFPAVVAKVASLIG